mmetsp:Transcript_78212/g.155031  ORF Transcript_78212/g.155031 Transcript_78212/m.155031 type:complete len:303 (+) Transcript_78212:118-1026(+)
MTGVHSDAQLTKKRKTDAPLYDFSMVNADVQPPLEYSGASANEWRSRVQLASCYRIIARFAQVDWGWTHCIYNHITVRLDDACCKALLSDGPLFLINPLGARFDEVTPASLHTIDLEGTIVRRGAGIAGVPDKGVLVAGFMIHRAVHAAREDVRAVFHTHHPDTVAVSTLKCGLLPCSLEACVVLATHSKTRHTFEGVSTSIDECDRIARDLGPSALTMTLDNHGVIACGNTLPHALRNLWLYTKACTYQVRALAAAGGNIDQLILVPQIIVDETVEREAKNQTMGALGETEFAAWMRGPAC